MTIDPIFVQEILADLEMQTMLFDMDIDYETLTLTPKSDYKEAFWITRWKEQENAKDTDNRLDYDQE